MYARKEERGKISPPHPLFEIIFGFVFVNLTLTTHVYFNCRQHAMFVYTMYFIFFSHYKHIGYV